MQKPTSKNKEEEQLASKPEKGSNAKGKVEEPKPESEFEQIRREVYGAAALLINRCNMLDEMSIRNLLGALMEELHNQTGKRVTMTESGGYPPKFPRR